MLILYKPYVFKFSDFEFNQIVQYVGRYKNNGIEIKVLRITTSPDLYNLYIYSRTSDDKVVSKGTEAEIEVYVNGLIKKIKYASII